jgi:hypothetical protein
MSSEARPVRRKARNPNPHLKVGAGKGFSLKQFVDDGTYKLISGVWHKRCSGSSHEEPTYLPATEKYFYRRKSKRPGEFLSQCRLCNAWKTAKSPGLEHGYVSVVKIRPFVDEAVNRIGLMELSRRTKVTPETLYNILSGRQANVQKKTVKKVMLELVSIKRKNEYSINAGSRWRLQRRGNSPDSIFCSECGVAYKNSEGEISVQTPGCDTCSNRLSKKRARAA